MHRLFVAIRPPRTIREQLRDLMGGIAGARWLSDDQLHLTLRFIGEVDRHVANDIHAALASIRHRDFSISLSGVGGFDRQRRTAVVWAGVTPQDELKSLHKKVDQALDRAGIPPDRRAFHPHVTLARLPRSAGTIEAFLHRASPTASAPFPVESFCLYESELTPAGPVYSILERYRLE